MEAKAGPGPERESVQLKSCETDTFAALVIDNTKLTERLHLSNALHMITTSQSIAVQDGFQRNARKMWRTVTP